MDTKAFGKISQPVPKQAEISFLQGNSGKKNNAQKVHEINKFQKMSITKSLCTEKIF